MGRTPKIAADIYRERELEIDQAVNDCLSEMVTPFTSFAITGEIFNGEDMRDAFLAGVEWAAFNLET